MLPKGMYCLVGNLLYSCYTPSGRKFGDIGNTVKLQYSSPALSLPSGWAGLVTCHALPGPGVVEGLKEVAVEGSGCVVVVEMSSQGSLTTPDYVTGTLCYTYILRQKAFINFVISQNYFPPLIFGVSTLPMMATGFFT